MTLCLSFHQLQRRVYSGNKYNIPCKEKIPNLHDGSVMMHILLLGVTTL